MLKSAGWLAMLVMCLAAFSAMVHAQAYKWVDEDGKVHYSQTVPPEKSELERERLSESGLLLDEPLYRTRPEAETPVSPEQETARLEQLKAEQRDRSLRVYSSQKQLEASRDQALAMIDGELKLARSGYENQLDTLERLVDFAAAQDRSGRAVDADLRARISANRKAAADEAQKIIQLQSRAEIIRQQFQDDVRRWRVLKGIDPPQADTTAADPEAGSAEPASAIDDGTPADPPVLPDGPQSG